MTTAFADLVEPLLSLFFPAHCAACGRRVDEGRDLCGDCAASVEKITPPRCDVCSQPVHGLTPVFTCPNCQDARFHFECAVSVVRSRGVVRDMVHRLKYGREVWMARVLAAWLVEGMGDIRFRGIDFDAIVPVPLHPRRLREREFNQAAVLAGHLARASNIPVIEPLARHHYTGTQTKLDRKERRQNLRGAFILRKNADVTDKDLLLVDDVLTTGSTLDACAAVLLAEGAASVRALTVARG